MILLAIFSSKRDLFSNETLLQLGKLAIVSVALLIVAIPEGLATALLHKWKGTKWNSKLKVFYMLFHLPIKGNFIKTCFLATYHMILKILILP